MKKINFINGQAPALNATNLNQLQTNIEQAIAVGGVAGDTLPIGSVVEFASDVNVPANWLLCNGQEVSRTEYDLLFAVIGTTWGEGDGSTTFNVPTKEGLITVGKKSSDENFNTIGKTGGEKTHTLTVDEMPSHNHSVESYKKAGTQTLFSNTSSGSYSYPNGIGDITIGYTGGSQPHNNLQPYVTSNFIIKAKQSAGVVATVVDSLESESATDALSAKQGKILKDSMLKTAIIGGSVTGKSYQTYYPDYSSIDGTVVASMLIGCINSQNNITVEKCVPHVLNIDSNKISSVTVTTETESETFIKILVLYR